MSSLRCPAAASHHQRLQRLHNMARSEGALVGAQPSSLPPNLLFSTHGGIARAPLPTPPPLHVQDGGCGHRRLAGKSPSPLTDGGDSAAGAAHYEVLPGERRGRRPRHDHDHHHNRGHYSADNTFDSMEIPMMLPAAVDDDRDLHYKVLHDREGHYSYAYDTSLSPAFLIRSASQSDSPGSASAQSTIRIPYPLPFFTPLQLHFPDPVRSTNGHFCRGVRATSI